MMFVFVSTIKGRRGQRHKMRRPCLRDPSAHNGEEKVLKMCCSIRAEWRKAEQRKTRYTVVSIRNGRAFHERSFEKSKYDHKFCIKKEDHIILTGLRVSQSKDIFVEILQIMSVIFFRALK